MFVEGVAAQAAWLGVPVVQSGGGGWVRTALPAGRGERLLRGAAWRLVSPLLPATRIVSATGETLAEVPPERGDACVVAEVTLGGGPPTPKGRQPRPRVPWLAYWLSDRLLPWLIEPTYRRNKQEVAR